MSAKTLESPFRKEDDVLLVPIVNVDRRLCGVIFAIQYAIGNLPLTFHRADGETVCNKKAFLTLRYASSTWFVTTAPP